LASKALLDETRRAAMAELDFAAPTPARGRCTKAMTKTQLRPAPALRRSVARGADLARLAEDDFALASGMRRNVAKVAVAAIGLNRAIAIVLLSNGLDL